MALQFHISIKNTKPLIWRRLIVPAGFNFYQLHLAIQGAFGWKNSHLFHFTKTGLSDKDGIGMPDPGDETKVHEAKDILISSIFKTKGDKQIYIYDFGDYWEHIVVQESIDDKEADSPVCVEGENECPPEDVGGVRGYEQMAECFVSGTEKENKEYKGWLGLKPKENWDPGYFNLRETNTRLARIFAKY